MASSTLSLTGLWRLLRRLGIVYKRGRQYIHSPDTHYFEKLAQVEQAKEQARASANAANPGKVVVLFVDAVTVYRQPTVACSYEAQGHTQPLARLSTRTNTQTRVIAGLNGVDGAVVYLRGRVSIERLVQFYRKVCATYPDAECIYVVIDNWPVYVHPDVLVALQPQRSEWVEAMQQRVPANWPKQPSAAALHKWGQLGLPIQLVPLPTYASWTNPIEKLWRKLRQELVHMHALADDLEQFRAHIDLYLDQFALGSAELLRYVGLAQPST